MTESAGGGRGGRPFGGPVGGPGEGAPESGRSRYARPVPGSRDIAPSPVTPAEALAAGSPRAATRGHRRRAFIAVARVAGPPAALAVVATAVLVAVAVLLSGEGSEIGGAGRQSDPTRRVASVVRRARHATIKSAS